MNLIYGGRILLSLWIIIYGREEIVIYHHDKDKESSSLSMLSAVFDNFSSSPLFFSFFAVGNSEEQGNDLLAFYFLKRL